MLFEFYKTNKPNWDKLETIITRAKRQGLHNLAAQDLQDLGRLYRKAASNLAYARTHRLEPELINYLNNLVGRAHALVYVPPANTMRQIILFFRQTFPSVLQKRVGFVLLAFALMAGAGVFGAFLQVRSPAVAKSFAAAVDVEGYYERFMDKQVFNDPLSQRPLISAAIMTNNIRVAVLCFAGGILLGLLTLELLYSNGLLLGVMTGAFIHHGHAFDFWATILPHGVTELTAICIAGGAGLLLGSALIHPGQYRRRDALVMRGREAVILFLGVVALLVFAGAIEGFISTIVTLGNAPRLAIAGLTALLLFPYLFWPRKGTQAGPKRDGLMALVAEEGLP